MICPVCHDEYRPGFTRCASCDVDLVESLEPASPPTAPAAAPISITEAPPDETMVGFCGYLTLDEARAARDTVRSSGRRAEILIRELPGGRLDQPAQEEYWLRVAPKDLRAVAALIGFDPGVALTEGDDSFQCSACGATVRATDTRCPGCGLGFEA